MILSLDILPINDFHQSENGYELGVEDLHIHYLDIRRFTDDYYAEAECNMSSDEHIRAQKFVRGKKKYIASRWLLRSTLARYLNLAPAAIEFSLTDKGKPYLAQNEVYFSLSHSGNWTILAVGRSQFVGVDIEVVTVTSRQDLITIAKNYYHPQEFAHLQTLAGIAQNDFFYRLWTLKEAFFKAIGTGISTGLDKITFELVKGRICCKIATSLNEDNNNWQFHQWTQDSQTYCALACKSQHPLQVIWFDATPTLTLPLQ